MPLFSWSGITLSGVLYSLRAGTCHRRYRRIPSR